jgi:hypothetical protein
MAEAVNELGKAADGMQFWSANTIQKLHDEQEHYDRFNKMMNEKGTEPAERLGSDARRVD